MKHIKLALIALGVLFGSTVFQSCSDDDDNYYYDYRIPNALVTVKPTESSWILQLDDNNILCPQNVKKSPYGDKEVRALVNFTYLPTDPILDNSMGRSVNINWIDSILTKPTMPNLGEEENIKKYGNDPVDIVRDWVTVAEDGYLTLRFRTTWGGQQAHSINLIAGVNPDDPYEVELRHNRNGDPQYRLGDALVAFRLQDNLPDTNGETVKLTIRWNSSMGEKTVQFDYCSRKSIASSQMLEGYDTNSTAQIK